MSIATWMTRCSARPPTTSSRPAARAASATALMRATLDANVVTATRWGASLTSSAMVLATSRSDGELPSRMAFVESPTSASTPSSPSAVRRASSGLPPMVGVASIFQSPVCRIVPSGVRMAIALLSGIEWDISINSTSNGPGLKAAVERDLADRNLLPVAVLGELRLQHAGREGRGVHRHAETRPQLDHRADVILVRVRDDDAGQAHSFLPR